LEHENLAPVNLGKKNCTWNHVRAAVVQKSHRSLRRGALSIHLPELNPNTLMAGRGQHSGVWRKDERVKHAFHRSGANTPGPYREGLGIIESHE